MALEVGPARPEDMAQISSVIFRAHRGEDPYLNALHPNNLTKEGQAVAIQKISDFANTSDQTAWEKVTDTATGEIVGTAIWLIFKDKKPILASDNEPLSADEEGDGDEEWLTAVHASLARVEAPFWDNELPLIIAPEYQHRGVGTILMNSGLKVVDKLGAKCLVISSDAARRLYEKSGFTLQRQVTLEVPEKFASKPVLKMLYMTREKAKDSSV